MTTVTLSDTTEYRIENDLVIGGEIRDIYAFWKDGAEVFSISLPAGTPQAEAFDILSGIQAE
jgi:hypothetical protein